MKSILAIFSLFISSLILSGCMMYINPHNDKPDGSQLASEISNQTVALVSDFGVGWDVHSAFCTGVWINQSTILTAAHCVAGYADMLRKVRIMSALVRDGCPEPLAKFLVSSGALDDVDMDDEETSDMLKCAAMIAKGIPPVNPLGLDIPFVIQSQIVDVGVASRGMLHSVSYTYSVRDDLALLKTNFDGEHSHIKLAGNAPLVGENVELVGMSLREWWTYKIGTVGAYRHSLSHAGMKDIDGPFMEINAAINHGDSGSGAFNDRGELVGINSFIREGSGQGYAIHLDTIRGFLIGAKLLSADLSPSKSPDLGDNKLNMQ